MPPWDLSGPAIAKPSCHAHKISFCDTPSDRSPNQPVFHSYVLSRFLPRSELMWESMLKGIRKRLASRGSFRRLRWNNDTGQLHC